MLCGCILASFWLHSGYILATFMLHLGYILATFRLYFGYILATFRLHFGPILKIEFGPAHPDFGSVLSPLKARKYRHMQQTTKMGILWHCQFDTLSSPVQIQFWRPLRGACNWIVLSPTLLYHLHTLVPSALKSNNFLVHQPFGPPNCFGPPHMCAVCSDFEEWAFWLHSG